MQDLVLLQTFLGLSLAVGIVASGSSINKTCQVANSRKIRISRQYVCQGCVILVSISIVIFSMLSTGYHTLCLVTWMYGLGLGGYRCEAEIFLLVKMIYWVFFFPRFFKNARTRARSGEIFHTRVGWACQIKWSLDSFRILNFSSDFSAGFIKGAESIPVLISIPLTGFLNDASLTSGKAGYYICSALTAISAVLMFFIGYPKSSTKYSTNG